MSVEDQYYRLHYVDRAAVVTPLGSGGNIAQEGARAAWPSLFAKIRDSGALGVVVDFERMDYIGSTALDWLAHMRRECQLPIALCNLAPTVVEVLDVAGMNHLWLLADSLPAAIAQVTAPTT